MACVSASGRAFFGPAMIRTVDSEENDGACCFNPVLFSDGRFSVRIYKFKTELPVEVPVFLEQILRALLRGLVLGVIRKKTDGLDGLFQLTNDPLSLWGQREFAGGGYVKTLVPGYPGQIQEDYYSYKNSDHDGRISAVPPLFT